MPQHWWDNPAYPQRVWSAVDWKAWKAAGSPPVPRGSAKLPLRSLDKPPIAIPDTLCPSGFSLYASKPISAGDRSREADRVLQQHGIGKRAARTLRVGIEVRRVPGEGVVVTRNAGHVLRVR